jgi:cytochrome c-type biogenesis protein CcmH
MGANLKASYATIRERKMMKKFLILFFLLPYCSLFAAEDYYQFSSAEQQQRFINLTSQLRCLVCQNQNLSQSNAPLANDLRNQVYQQLKSGNSDQDIINYLIKRYGDFILYKPPFNIKTLALWFGPFVLLILGLCYLFLYINKQRDHS